MKSEIDVVIPTIGRPSLTLLLAALDGLPDRLPTRIILVDDRRKPDGPLPTGMLSPAFVARLQIVASGGRGPAAARNTGWRAGDAPSSAHGEPQALHGAHSRIPLPHGRLGRCARLYSRGPSSRAFAA